MDGQSLTPEKVVLIPDATKENIIDIAIALNTRKVIALDIFFECNDQLKTNTVWQMKDAGMEFKTI